MVVFASLFATAILSCKKNDDDEKAVSNVDLTGEYQGVLVVVGDSSFTDNIVITFTKVSGSTYSLELYGSEEAQVVVKGNSFSGSGADVTSITGSLVSTALSFKAKLSDGGTADFSGTKLTGGGGNGDINVNGVEYDFLSSECDDDGQNYQMTFSYVNSDGSASAAVLSVEFFETDPPTPGTYTIVNKAGYDLVEGEVAAFCGVDNISYQATKGSIQVSDNGGLTVTVSALNFDYDNINMKTVTNGNVATGTGKCN